MGRRGRRKSKKNSSWGRDLLPLGAVYMDRCFNFVFGAPCWEREVKEFENAKKLINTYEERNELLITPEIHKEFGNLIGKFRREKLRLEKLINGYNVNLRGTDEFRESKRNLGIAIEAMEFYEGLRDRLLDNYDRRGRVSENVDVSEVKSFFDNVDADFGEGSLIYQMFLRKKEKATFFSSDGGALKICRKGFLKLKRSGFIYDARYSALSEFCGE